MSSDKIFLFIDLDDTLIQAKKKTDFSKESLVGAYSEDKKISSYIYRERKDFFDKVVKNPLFEVIPTTERDFNSYSRTVFYQQYKFNYVILNFSATLLTSHKIDLQWKAHIDSMYQKLPIKVFEILQLIEKQFAQQLSLKLSPKIKLVDNYYITISDRNPTQNREDFEKIGNVVMEFMNRENLNSLFYVYKNSNSYGILPKFLSKKYAVKHLINRHKPFFTIGAGDNISDLDFMNETDFSLIPNNSTLNSLLNIKSEK